MKRSLLAVGLVFAACKNTPSEPPTPPPAQVERTPEPGLPPGHPPMGSARHVPVPSRPTEAEHALRWRDPPGWRRTPPASSMRRAQYQIPGPAGDAELAVFFFGVGQGGDIEQNIQRWHGQFERTDAPPTRASRQVGSLRATVTYATGRFNVSGMGAGPSGPRDNWALLGGIVETTQGPWFFKMTGPAATVSAARGAFEALIDSAEW